jgi:hypothetical protein
LSKKPNLTQLVSGPGIPIFIALLTPSTIEEISLNTGYKKSVIYKFIHDARQRSLLKNESSIYSLNDKLWLDFREVLEEIKKTELNIDSRVPITSIIYFKNQKEIIYSNKDDLIAELTAFSAYEDFGIKLLTITYYYYLPQKILTKREVFIHSLYVTEKDFSIQHLIFIALFLAKYKEELSDIKHTIVVNLLKVFLGEKIKGYPSISEIKDRAEIYGIEV